MRRVRVSSHQSPVHRLGDEQMKLTPKFRLAPPAASPELPPCPEIPLIPGLPDDIAVSCLLRLPVESHFFGKLVCRRWRCLLASKAGFFTLRRTFGLSSPWLFTLASNRCTGKIQWQVLDVDNLSWHAIPAMPCRDGACPRGFGCLAVPSTGSLLVCSGFLSDADSLLHFVLKYDVFKNRWTVINRMLAARSFFAGGVIDGQVYVAGGYSADRFELDSAEVLDLSSGQWLPVASMGTNMASADSAVLDGKLYATEGCVWPFFSAPRGQVYDPKVNRWEPMPAGMREGWTGRSAVVDGQLFVVSEYEKMRIKVYNKDGDSWDAIEGAPAPERIRKPYAVSSVGRRLILVGQGMQVAIGHIETAEQDRQRYSVRWEEADRPPRLAELTPSNAQMLYA